MASVTKEQALAELARRELERRNPVSTDNRQVTVQERIRGLPIGGLPMAIAGIKDPEANFVSALKQSEEILPVLGEEVGSAVPIPPLRPVTAGIGAGVGEAARQGINLLKGEQGSFDLKGVRDAGLVTAGVEGVFRLPGAAMFRKFRALEETTKGAGTKLNKINSEMVQLSKNNPAFRVKSSKLLKLINNIETSLVDKSGQAGAVLRRFKKEMQGRVSIDYDFLKQFESRIDDAIKPAKKAEGTALGIQNKKLNKALIGLRSRVSDIADNLAEKAGYRDVKKLNKTVSNAFKVLDEPRGSVIRTAIASGGLGGLVFSLTQNPALGFGTSLAGMAALHPEVEKLAFNAIEKSGLGRAVTLAAAEAFRRFVQAQKEN